MAERPILTPGPSRCTLGAKRPEVVGRGHGGSAHFKAQTVAGQGGWLSNEVDGDERWR